MNDKTNDKNPKDRRSYIRIPLLSEACTWVEYVGPHVVERRADMKDITVAGVFIKSDYMPKIGSMILLKFEMPNNLGTITMNGKIVRLRWVKTKKFEEPKGFGVQFLEANAVTKKLMDAYVTYLRNKQIIVVSKRIIEEFFGSKGPRNPL